VGRIFIIFGYYEKLKEGQVKVLAAISKYIPQIFLNYSRKSVQGYSVYTMILDFSGGFFSLAEMYFTSYNDEIVLFFGILNIEKKESL
jgi:hypothetical protein